MDKAFFAMINRMKLINRWSLMRNTSTENIQEHSLQVAILAHALAVIRKEWFADGRICPEPERVIAYAVFHDASEIITGDMPTPVKYFKPELREAYQEAEDEANSRLLAMLPPDMREHYLAYFSKAATAEEQAIHEIVKAADKLAAYIKCVEEIRQGNPEFKAAKDQCWQKVVHMDLPELEFFCNTYLPAFELTLDELQADDHVD